MWEVGGRSGEMRTNEMGALGGRFGPLLVLDVMG